MRFVARHARRPVFPHRGKLSGPARFLLALAAAAAAAVLPARAEPAMLTVGQGWAWVRESFPSSGEMDVDRIVWTNPPPQIDLDTLQVWNVRRPWAIREWRWAQPPAAAAEDHKPLVWRPRAPPAPPPPHDRLDILLAEPLSHRMGHSLTYRLPDFDWTVFYRVVVRGIGPQSIDAVQVDLAGYLRIHNGTATAFPDARISLVGTDESLQPPPKPFGRLELNPDTALTDLWLAPPKSEPLIPSRYPLQIQADIPADGQAEIQFARVTRKPAQIAHVCDSADIPSPTPTGGLPLRRILLVPNAAMVGLGFPLPPGQADLFLGTLRGAPALSGPVRQTPFPGTLRIDMGPADTVRASRQMVEEISLPEGAGQADHTIALVNDLASPVRIQVVETPSTPMEWHLVRSSIPCTQTTRTLNFDLTLPPQSSKTIAYRLRLVARSQ